jgi:mercuric ion binding protein
MTNFWQRAVLVSGLALISAGTFAAQQAYKLRVDGLACPFCAYGVEKKLNAIKGVEGIGVDIASGTVNVTMAEGASLDEAAANQAVKDAGFTLRKFEPAQPAAQTK